MRYRLRITQTFPAMISVPDLISGIFHGIDHITSTVHGYVPANTFCTFLGYVLLTKLRVIHEFEMSFFSTEGNFRGGYLYSVQ